MMVCMSAAENARSVSVRMFPNALMLNESAGGHIICRFSDRDNVVPALRPVDILHGNPVLLRHLLESVGKASALLTRISQCAQTARFTSGGRYHPASCRLSW